MSIVNVERDASSTYCASGQGEGLAEDYCGTKSRVGLVVRQHIETGNDSHGRVMLSALHPRAGHSE